jgi:hypothetical protein
MTMSDKLMRQKSLSNRQLFFSPAESDPSPALAPTKTAKQRKEILQAAYPRKNA